MSSPSNLYAEKIYSEHPLVLWALDDQLDYISLISEDQRDITEEWDLSNEHSVSGVPADIGQPFFGSVTTEIQCELPNLSQSYTECISPDIINFTNLDSNISTFCIGTYVYIDSDYISSIDIGYKYTDTTSAQDVIVTKSFNYLDSKKWVFISGTFEKPSDNTNLKIYIKINKSNGGIEPSYYKIYFNGISLGQWSEEFNKTSLGIDTIAFPANISLNQTYAIAADAYGVGEKTGYYLTNQTSLKARNSGIPMVYGANSVTTLYPQDNNDSGIEGNLQRTWDDVLQENWQYWNDQGFSWSEFTYTAGDKPSLIVPGQGFLNNAGKYKEFTVEFWLKANSDTKTSKRIFGPIASSDGIYIKDGFITLVIGKYFMSHFINEWYRPMLIDLRVSNQNATLLINGEEVISLNIDLEQVEFPNQYDLEGKSQDWLGFYAYNDITPVLVDCIAIYSYLVPTVVAKRRFVYGQGVVSPEGINSSYGGVTAYIDYPFADYTANYKYPDFARWEQASFDNLAINTTSVSLPNYSLPNIFIEGQSLDLLYKDNKQSNESENDSNTYFTFRPNSSWNTVDSYLNFSNFNFLREEIKAIYGVFSSTNLSTNQTLFKIQNTINNNYFIAKQNLNVIEYSIVIDGQETILETTSSISSGVKFAAGINIIDLIDRFGGNVASFFGNRNGLQLYVAGSNTDTFLGKLYNFGLCSLFNLQQAIDYFDNGFAIKTQSTNLLNFTASYTLMPYIEYNQYFLDINAYGYWEDYMPLSYFGQYVQDSYGDTYYDLDFLQFNIGYPAPSKAEETEIISSWSYGELQESYASPTQKQYGQLDNYVYTGYNNYEDLEQKSEKHYPYNTSGSYLNSYITFQYIESGANNPKSYFTQTSEIHREKIIDANDYTDWEVRKFNVIDNTIIYPPKEVDFTKLAIVYHIDFYVKQLLHHPISLKQLEISSQALNNNSFNPIGTRFGINLFPYKQNGFYYDYKAKNPYSIYKGSSPYLYLTKNSGIEVRGDFDPLSNRGISFPINQSLGAEYKVSSIQIWSMYSYDLMPASETPIFEIKHKDDKIKFYLISDNEIGNRGRIFAKSNKTGNKINNLEYYINGTQVFEPVINIKEWNSIGIEFPSALDFNSYLGSFNINGPLLVNNISYYQANNTQQVQSRINRSWAKTKTDRDENISWGYWLNNFTWGGMRSISETDIYLVNPSDVYKTYIGTNKIIIDDQEGIVIDSDKLKVYNDISWSSSIRSAV